MKQSQNQTETIQVLYELALSIGSSLDLPQMLAVSMQAFAEKLGCVVSTVYRCQTTQTAWQFEAVATNTHAVDKTDTAQMALAMLPNSAAAPTVAQCMATLPLVGPGADGDYYHLLELPGFGALLLIKDEAPLDKGMVEALRPLQEKLAAAANACIAAENSPHAEEESQTILESITTPLLISRISDGLILYANDLLAQMIGTTTEQLIGNITPDFYANTDDRKTLLTKLQAQGILTNYELQIKRSNGELIWVLLSIKPFNYQGEPALIATFLEITERKQTLQQLRESRERARAILESVTLPLIISRLEDGAVLYANDRVAEMMGMTTEEIIGHRTPDFYRNPEDRTKIVQGALTQGGVDNVELPISRNGEPRWALISNRLTEYDDQRAIITTLVDITDRKLAEETQVKRAAELETVARVSASTARILETDKLLQEVVDLTKERFGLYHAHIYLLNKAGDTLVLTAGAGEIGQKMVTEKRSIPLSQEQSLVAQAARTRQGVIENDVLNNPAFLPHPLLPNTRAEMAVPVLIGDRVIGVLDTQADQVGWFTQQDILIKTTLAAQVAVALENARSFESARTSLAETEALLDITKESSRTLELQVIMESVLDRVLAATKFEAGLISLENPTTQTLELFSHRLPGQFLQALQKNGLDNTLCDMVYRQQKSIVVVNLNDDAPVDVSGLIRLGFQSYQGVPIAAKGDVFGTICLFSNHLLSSDEANTVFLQAVGQQVGIAIQNANLLKQTQVALAEVEQSREVVQEYLDMQRVLHEINTELLQVDDLDGLYYRAIELAHTRLGFERIGMYLLNEAKDTLLGTYGVDTNGEVRTEQGPEHVITDPQTIQTYILNRTRLTVAEDIDLLQENTVVGHGWHMGAAMWAEEAPIGVIFADNLVTGQPLKPYQSELLFAYARTVASLIVRRRSEAMIRERETLLRTIIDSTPDWIFVKDRDHRYELVNQGYANSMHMEPDAFIGKNDLDIGFPEEIVRGNPKKGIRGFWADDNEIMDSGERKIIDEEPAVIEGEARTLHTIKVPLHDANGEVTGLVGFVHDITKQKATEEALQAAKEYTETILHSITVPILISQVKSGEIRYANEHLAEMVGMPLDELIGNATPNFYVRDEDRTAVVGTIRAEGSVANYQLQLRRANGETFWGLLTARLIQFEDETAIMTSLIDITDRKAAEERVRANEELMRTIIDSTPDWIFVKDHDHRYRLVNQGYADSMHMAPEEFIGKNDLDIGFPEEIVKGNPDKGIRGFWADDNEIMASGERKIIDEEPAVVDGEARVLHTVKVPLHDTEGEVAGLVGFVHDITNRKQIEVTLHQSEEKFRSLFEQSADAYLILEDNLFVDCNQATVDLLRASSKEEVLSLHPSQFSPERQPDGRFSGEKADEMIETAVKQGNHRFEWIHRRVDGEDFFAEVLLTPISMGGQDAVFAVIRDVTDRQQAQATIAKRAAEMQAVADVGRTAATILDTRELLQEVVDLSKSNFDLYHAHIYLLDAEAETLLLTSGSGEIGRQMVAEGRQIPLMQEQSLVARAARLRQGVVINDVQAEPGFLPHPMLPDTRAEMAVPLIAGEQVLGVLDVQSDQSHQFTQEDISVFTTLAAQTAVALQNARLFTQSEERARELSFVNRIVTEINTLDTKNGLNFLAKELGEALQTPSVVVGLIDGSGTMLELVAALHPAEAPSPVGAVFPVDGDPIMGQAIQTRQTVVIENVANFNLEAETKEEILRTGTRSMYVIPMIVGRDLIGTVSVNILQGSSLLTPDQLEMAETTVYQAATAVQNARLFEQAQAAFNNVERSQAELSQALEIAKLAYWEYDVEQDLFTFNDQFYAIFHTTAEAHGGYQLSSGYYAQNFVHPDDTSMVGSEIGVALSSTDRHYTRLLEHRILYADGGIGYISVNVTLERDEHGKITRFYGANQDITNRKLAEEVLRRSEAELSQALAIAKLGYWEYDVAQDLFTFNDQFYSLFHTTAEAHGGYRISSGYYAQTFVHPDDVPMVGSEIGRALGSTERHYTRLLEHRILYADGGIGYISVNVTLERDEQGNIVRFYGANQDITDRKLVEQAVAKQAQELQIVAELSTTVATTLEQEKLLQEVVDLTKERFEFYHAQIYLLNMQQNRLALAFGAGEVGHTLVAQKHQIALDAPQSLVAQAARSGQAVVVNDVRENPDWLPNKLLPETQAEMAVPLMVGDRVVGVLDVQSERLNRFTDQDVQIQTTLAAQVSIALENARSFEQAQTAVAEMNALARRLTHEGWDDYFDNVREEKLSFLFDGMSVQEAEEASFNATLQEDEKELLERAIEVRGVKIGKMAIVAEEEDPELEEVVNSVMQQLASHIENLRLTEQVQTSLAQTEALYTGSERIVLSSTEADVLESLIYSTQLRHLDRANIFLFDQPVEDNVARDVTAVAVWEHEGVPHTVDVGTRFTVAQVPFMSMITAEASMVVEDIRQDPRVDDSTRQILESYGMISFVLFPMVVGSQWLGMVSGQSARPVYMSDVQRRQASSLVSQASVVLQTTILFRQEQARARREQMLRAIAAKVRSSTDVDSIMRTAVTEIGRTLGRRAFIKLSDGQLMDTAEENGVAL